MRNVNRCLKVASLTLLFVFALLTLPAHADLRSSPISAEMYLPDAVQLPDGTYIVGAGEFNDLTIIARGQFDRLEKDWTSGATGLSFTLPTTYYPRNADWHAGDCYLWTQEGAQGLRWAVPTICTLELFMYRGQRRMLMDRIRIVAVPGRNP